jgi:hypothetical protein
MKIKNKLLLIILLFSLGKIVASEYEFFDSSLLLGTDSNNIKRAVGFFSNSQPLEEEEEQLDILPENDNTLENEDLFACFYKDCGQTFPNQETTVAHIKAKHDTGAKALYQCTESSCGKTFGTKFALSLHSKHHEKKDAEEKSTFTRSSRGREIRKINYAELNQDRKSSKDSRTPKESVIKENQTAALACTSYVAARKKKNKGDFSKTLKISVELVSLQAAAQKVIEEKRDELKRKNIKGKTHSFMIECPVCKIKIKIQSMVKHQKMHLSDDVKTQIKKATQFKCHHPECGKSFTEKHIFNQHKKGHSKPHQCTWPNCNISFSRKNSLKKHMSTHTGVYEFYCDRCKNGYTSQSRLNKHSKKCKGKN